jgi:hypothetical protein
MKARALRLALPAAMVALGTAAPLQAAPLPAATLRASTAEAPAKPIKPTLVLRGLDKITGRPVDIVAPLNVPVSFASLTITARYCYSTPPIETPQTAAFVQIDDHRSDQPARRVFSGWMYASSPALNGMEHPLYDVWVITCRTSEPGEARPVVAAKAPVKVASPDATDKEGLAPLPEGADQ